MLNMQRIAQYICYLRTKHLSNSNVDQRSEWFQISFRFRGNEECVQNFDCKARKKETTQKAWILGRIILKHILTIKDWRLWTGFVWFRLRKGYGSSENGNKLSSPKKAINFLTSWATISFARNLFSGIRLKLHNEELHNLFSLPSNIRIDK
jgi:hypothetical protein